RSGASFAWKYDVFGNQVEESGNPFRESEPCSYTSARSYVPDNRLLARAASGSCYEHRRYWVDQAGRRLAETDTLNLGGGLPTPLHLHSKMSYTAAGQLYFALTPAADQGSYDASWHYYDATGLRVATASQEVETQFEADPRSAANHWLYYVYDGSDVAFTLQRQGGLWRVQHRYLTAGLDQPLVVRTALGSTVYETLGLIGDRQETTISALRPDGVVDTRTWLYDRNPFGAQAGAGSGSRDNEASTGTGYTGASTPTAAGGGFVYLRHRWYDPNTGRFLTQDPIGLAGGINLYAYAGSNPVAFSDPFGLDTVTVGHDPNGDLAA